MNKTALKNFATNARKELIEKVKAKAFKIGITDDNIKKSQFESSDVIYIDGKQLSATEKKQREKLILRIQETGFKQVVEEVAYTWFNRLTALRFMEVNNYLPTKVRVLSSNNADGSEPDIIKEALTVDLEIDKEKVYELKLNNKTEELFKYLVIKQCNSLNKVLSFMFETIDDYMEILFPEGLLTNDSFLREMTDTDKISEFDWQQVEIIGWLYQYYIADEKDRVIKAKKKYKTDEIPFATQLFTPEWIVKYMVQNTLGRYWIEAHPEHNELKNTWKYYVEGQNKLPNFDGMLVPYINKELKVEDIKCFDPAMGSGHILVYMFEVLFEIYSKCGYMEREIPRLIIENNLYGLDIDDRAYQLACFSVVMKAMQYNNRFFRTIERDGLTLRLTSIQETNQFSDLDIAYLVGESKGENFEKARGFIERFKNAKTYGSLIKVEEYDIDFMQQKLDNIRNNPVEDIFEEQSRNKIIDLLPEVIKQTDLMCRRYSIVVTNPPYLGNKYMNESLSEFAKENYSDVKSDIFSIFIQYCMEKTEDNGHIGLLTPFVWMFISSYEKLRENIVTNKNISSLIQLEYNAFPEACVPVCTFTLRNYSIELPGEYIKLSDFTGSENQSIKTLEAIQNPSISYRYSFQQDNYSKVPGCPIAFWSSIATTKVYEKATPLGNLAEPKQGMATADNKRFVRNWFEVSIDNIGFGARDRTDAKNKKTKWFPYNNGGGYRKWYGNNIDVVNWRNDGEELRSFPNSVIRSPNYYFQRGITWNAITSSKLSLRMFDEGFIFSNAGMAIYEGDTSLELLIAYLNSNVVQYLLSFVSNTLNFNQGDIVKAPIIINEEFTPTIIKLSRENIQIAKADWDSFESSWDFNRHPLIEQFRKDNKMKSIAEAYDEWLTITVLRFNQLKKNEEELNRVLIANYSLQEEISPIVLDEDISISKADREREVKSLISYAIGCLFGRYSIDKTGLIYAGGEFDQSNYQTFKPDKDNILSILAGVYFEDDIVSKFFEFIKVAFSEEKFKENLEYIAESLGRREGETAIEAIRRYFLTDFYKDHTQIYKKSPIYWKFTSGKQKAFNCLIYMHRYDRSTLSRIRTDYLHELQIRMDAEKKTLLDIINGEGTTKEIANAKKELKSLDLKIEELRAYDEKLHHMADMQIEIDLDDGVAVNYAKFEGLLAPIK